MDNLFMIIFLLIILTPLIVLFVFCIIGMTKSIKATRALEKADYKFVHKIDGIKMYYYFSYKTSEKDKQSAIYLVCLPKDRVIPKKSDNKFSKIDIKCLSMKGNEEGQHNHPNEYNNLIGEYVIVFNQEEIYNSHHLYVDAEFVFNGKQCKDTFDFVFDKHEQKNVA